MTDIQGQVTLSRSFTPWGELLGQTGVGDTTWGHLGGVLDAATSLIYVGNGQYYDPATGGSSPAQEKSSPARRSCQTIYILTTKQGDHQ